MDGEREEWRDEGISEHYSSDREEAVGEKEEEEEEVCALVWVCVCVCWQFSFGFRQLLHFRFSLVTNLFCFVLIFRQ